jgi:DNA-binding winged helix-turn-helix (wHTH) protein/dipeptidyl aminopeptidase/acylaminoacyl peptidase
VLALTLSPSNALMAQNLALQSRGSLSVLGPHSLRSSGWGMGNSEETGPSVRFQNFQVNLETGELWKAGVRVKVQDQPFKVLVMLLQRPGQIVTREELRHLIWPNENFGDFDHAINLAVAKLRAILGDSADVPHLIETLPRRGYRFIAPVESPATKAKVSEVPPAAALPPVAEPAAAFAFSKKFAVLLLLLGVVIFGVVVLLLNQRTTLPTVVDSVQITKDGLPKDVLRLVSDGTRLYFQESSQHGVTLMQVSTQGGEPVRLPVALEDPMVYDISPNHSELLVGGHTPESESAGPEELLWVVPLPAGAPHRVGDIVAHDACWMPDGNHLAFVNNKDIFIARPDGSDVRKLAAATGFVPLIRVSPDGKRLRFTVLTASTHPEKWDVMEIGIDGGGLHRVPIEGCCGSWSTDGKYYFYQGDQAGQRQRRVSGIYRNIWTLPERRSLIGEVRDGTPARLTTGPLPLGALTPSADGKQLFVLGYQERVELARYESGSKKFVPFLGGISIGELEVSPDGQWVAYTTYPESTLWRSKLDGSERLQLTFTPTNVHEPRWSPDGKQILFSDWPMKLFVISAEGGTPHQLMPEAGPALIGAGAWLPPGDSLIFCRAKECPAEDYACYEDGAIYRLNLKTQEVAKIPRSDKMYAARVSPDGRYIAALSAEEKLMLYDFQTETWSKLSETSGAITWSRDSKSVYFDVKKGARVAEMVRVRVPSGKMESVVDLTDVSLGGFWPDWTSLLPDDSPLLMLDKSTQEIYRLELQYR